MTEITMATRDLTLQDHYWPSCLEGEWMDLHVLCIVKRVDNDRTLL